MELYIAVIIGGLLYIGFQLNGVLILPDFNWKYFFKSNIIPLILNLMIGLILVYIRSDLVNIYPVTKLTALFLGFSGQVTFKKLQNIFDPAKKTYLSLGKEDGEN